MLNWIRCLLINIVDRWGLFILVVNGLLICLCLVRVLFVVILVGLVVICWRLAFCCGIDCFD